MEYNCAKNCSFHCLHDYLCDKQTGRCHGGCDPGYTNSDCKKGKTTDHKHVHFVINCFNCFCFKIQMHLLIFDNILKLVQLITTSDVTSGLFYIECSLGHFGLDCRNRCSSHCTNGEPCNHISGSCPNGCQDGFVGTKCNNCKKYLFIQLN